MRSFVETAELTRNVLLGRGYSVERIYTTNTDFQDAFVADPTPRRFFNGALLPAAIGPGFAWSGNATNVVNAFNAGRFLVFHRDHGGSTSWGDPSFSTGNFGSLTNSNRLPIVYSVNCASGNWDRETDGGGSLESFMEQLLMLSGGGMVGGLATTATARPGSTALCRAGSSTPPGPRPRPASAAPPRSGGSATS